MNANATVAETPDKGFDIHVDTLIIGAGACGLVAALAAREKASGTTSETTSESDCKEGCEVLVVEADAIASGSTALSAGLIPASGTRIQQASGIHDSAQLFAADIQAKAHHENDQDLVEALATDSSVVIDWLCKSYQLPFSLVDDFDYPGHSRRRMHGLPTRSGVELINALRARCEAVDIELLFNRRASVIHHESMLVTGITLSVSDGSRETIGCNKLILACNGFGGNRDMVKRFLPVASNAVWFGHDGNRGEALDWGTQLGASIVNLGAYQGHGNVAHPQGILISWAVITQGGVQVNQQGLRFWDESQGYSEAAAAVLSQEDGTAITIFDERIAAIARQFEDFKQAEKQRAVLKFDSLHDLAKTFRLPADTLHATIARIPQKNADEFGRVFSHQPLEAPYYAVRVTGALFHTQGGLQVNSEGRVKHESGEHFSNLFAGGGAAVGVSGTNDSGYLSGNGLLSAVVLGYRAGMA